MPMRFTWAVVGAVTLATCLTSTGCATSDQDHHDHYAHSGQPMQDDQHQNDHQNSPQNDQHPNGPPPSEQHQ